MSSAQISKPCAVPPAAALERAVAHLLTLGYQVKERGADQIKLVFAKGSRGAAHLNTQRHNLLLVADGAQLHFDFWVGTRGSGLVTKKDRAALDARAHEVTKAALLAPAAATAATDDTFRCRYCGNQTSFTAPACQRCGAENFS